VIGNVNILMFYQKDLKWLFGNKIIENSIRK
jgi:hypothetical protein